MEYKKAMFGAGCFWGVELAFSKLDGVQSTKVGYAGGHTQNPNYREVCTDTTGHVEVVHIEYDESKISYKDLVICFFNLHDPTTLNRQGVDVGTQYRSAVFYFDDEQKRVAEQVKDHLQNTDEFKERKIVTEIVAEQTFYLAETYHQEYLKKRGLDSCSI